MSSASSGKSGTKKAKCILYSDIILYVHTFVCCIIYTYCKRYIRDVINQLYLYWKDFGTQRDIWKQHPDHNLVTSFQCTQCSHLFLDFVSRKRACCWSKQILFEKVIWTRKVTNQINLTLSYHENFDASEKMEKCSDIENLFDHRKKIRKHGCKYLPLIGPNSSRFSYLNHTLNGRLHR